MSCQCICPSSVLAAGLCQFRTVGCITCAPVLYDQQCTEWRVTVTCLFNQTFFFRLAMKIKQSKKHRKNSARCQICFGRIGISQEQGGIIESARPRISCYARPWYHCHLQETHKRARPTAHDLGHQHYLFWQPLFGNQRPGDGAFVQVTRKDRQGPTQEIHPVWFEKGRMLPCSQNLCSSLVRFHQGRKMPAFQEPT